MIAIKTTMEYMPSDCDYCRWFGTRPHPYKGWTDICELMGHCMDDDQPEEWIYSGDGRPKACPLIELEDHKTESIIEVYNGNADKENWQGITFKPIENESQTVSLTSAHISGDIYHKVKDEL